MLEFQRIKKGILEAAAARRGYGASALRVVGKSLSTCVFLVFRRAAGRNCFIIYFERTDGRTKYAPRRC